jgi:DNA-binding winged helix-turn-helix (wHTH) protein/Tfp pilus assembly protein PilF
MRKFRFGPFTLDAQERRLLRAGEAIALTPKVFDTLVYLVEHQGRLVGKNELMESVWSDAYVEDGNLPRTIHVLRKALAGGDNDLKYIETVPTKGYRFVADVIHLDEKREPEISTADAREKSEGERRAGPVNRRVLVTATTVVVIALAASGWRALDLNGRLARLVPATASGAAYSKYQMGQVYMERHYPGDDASALENFQQATELDPRFAAAYAGKADAKLFLYWKSGSHDDIAQARIAISKAIELDPNSSNAHALLCRIRATYDWDFPAAENECRRAVELDPQNQDARRELAFLLNSLGREYEALKEMDVAIALAPTSFNKQSRGLLLYFDRRFDEAINQLKQVETTDPEYSESSRWIARCLEQTKQYGRALEFFIKFRESGGAAPEEISRLRRAIEAGGWPELLRVSLDNGQAKPNLETAGTFAQLGEVDKAFDVLEGMIKNRRPMIVHMDSDPRLDPLRSDPRFEQFAKRVGLR